MMASRQEGDLGGRRTNGRTWRRRNKRKSLSTRVHSIDCSPVLVRLSQWLQSPLVKQLRRTRLKPAVFPDTGRGLMAVSALKAGETVVRIPRGAMVTCDDVFKTEQIGSVLRDSSTKFRAMEVLSIFLIFQRTLGKDSKWKPYIDTLPTEYSVPAFCLENEVKILPEFLKCIVQKQKEDVRHCFENTQKIFRDLSCTDGFNYSPSVLDIRWAWFTVNTRAVYLKNNDPNPLLSDDDIYALAPYLDLLNHSHTAQVETGLNESSGCYEIDTLVPYGAHDQVFINYGPHDNIKLYREYGFILPNNPHNSVPFTLEQLLLVIKGFEEVEQLKARKEMLYEKQKIVVSQRIDENLAVSLEGPSWNFEVALTILLMTPEELRRWQVVFQDLRGVGHRPFVLQCLRSACKDKFTKFSTALMDMEGIGECTEAFVNGKELVKECCAILSNVLNIL